MKNREHKFLDALAEQRLCCVPALPACAPPALSHPPFENYWVLQLCFAILVFFKKLTILI